VSLVPKLPRDVQVVLFEGNAEVTLTTDEAEAVAEAFDHVRISARKYRAMSGSAGRLLLIDPDAIAEINRFLTQRRARATGG
jgi:hypothetical protein